MAVDLLREDWEIHANMLEFVFGYHFAAHPFPSNRLASSRFSAVTQPSKANDVIERGDFH